MGGCVARRGKVGVGPGFLALEQVVRRGRIMKLMWFVAGDPFFTGQPAVVNRPANSSGICLGLPGRMPEASSRCRPST